MKNISIRPKDTNIIQSNKFKGIVSSKLLKNGRYIAKTKAITPNNQAIIKNLLEKKLMCKIPFFKLLQEKIKNIKQRINSYRGKHHGPDISNI